MPEKKQTQRGFYRQQLQQHHQQVLLALRKLPQLTLLQADSIRLNIVSSYHVSHASWTTTYFVKMLRTTTMLSLVRLCLRVSVANPKQIALKWHFQDGLAQILTLTDFSLFACAPLSTLGVETRVRLFSASQARAWARIWLSIPAMFASSQWEPNVVYPLLILKGQNRLQVSTFILLNMMTKMSILRLSMSTKLRSQSRTPSQILRWNLKSLFPKRRKTLMGNPKTSLRLILIFSDTRWIPMAQQHIFIPMVQPSAMRQQKPWPILMPQIPNLMKYNTLTAQI